MDKKKILAGFFIGLMSIMVVNEFLLQPSISMYEKHGIDGVFAHLIVLIIVITGLRFLFRITDWPIYVLFFNKKKKVPTPKDEDFNVKPDSKDMDFVLENDPDIEAGTSERTDADNKVVREYIQNKKRK